MKKVRPRDAIRRAYQHLAASFSGVPLTLPQTAVLDALLQLGPQNQTQLVEATGIDRSTMADMLRRLATMRAIVALRMESDRRANLISITPMGRSLLRKADIYLSVAEANMMQLVPAPDRPVFLRALTAIVEAQTE